jgi:macrolide-specific efflux system membrane fusion protein
MKKKPTHTWHYLLGAVAVAAIAFGVKTTLFAAPPAPRYATAHAVLADLEETVLASGTLQAFKQVSVGAQASGQLKSLKVALGEQVEKGQLIAEIDSLTQQNSLRTAQAALESVRAQRVAKQALVKSAELAWRRQNEMFAQNASSREAFESAEATMNTTRADVAALDAQIAQATIAVDTAKINLGYTKITAPIAGIVVAVVTQEGQTVNANQQAPTIVKLAKLDTLTVKAQISEADIIRVSPGQQVYFTILGEPDNRYHATLRAIEPAPDSISTDTTTSSSTSSSSTSSSTSSSSSSAIYYNGLFEVPNPDKKLRISMTAQVNIVLKQTRQAVSIPATALGKRSSAGTYPVRVLGKDGAVDTRQVTVGINNTVNAEILRGLQAGEIVIVGDSTGVAEKAAAGNNRRQGPPPMRI